MKTNYKSSTALSVALCALGLSVGAGFAGDKSTMHHESGTISSVDAAKHQLVISDSANNKPQTFAWNDSTKFMENSKPVAAGQLKSGERVRLSYEAGAGTPVLREVAILPQVAKTSTPYKAK